MNKILIIPDVHGRPFYKQAVEQCINECEKIIFLGDYVDPYPDEGITRKQAIETLENIIKLKRDNMDKVVLLIGNHCAHYFINGFPRSTRYDSSNAYHIRDLYNANLNLFKLAHEETVNNKTFLFTHAGAMRSWVERNQNVIGEPTVENLNSLMNSNRGIQALSDVSTYRSWTGEESGSILWSDVREKIDKQSTQDNIIPKQDSIIDQYDFQVFGHTQVKQPIITDKWACIDTHVPFVIDDETNIKPL